MVIMSGRQTAIRDIELVDAKPGCLVGYCAVHDDEYANEKF